MVVIWIFLIVSIIMQKVVANNVKPNMT